MSKIFRKICLVGDFNVGKTSLIRRFVDQQFSDQYLSTVGVKISRKTIITSSSEKPEIQLLIWDIEGSTKFKTVAPNYLQGAKGAIIVADLTRSETLEHLANHIQGFSAINPEGTIVIALNKSDLIDPDKLERSLYFPSFKTQSRILDIYLTSAKTGENVESLFRAFAN